MRKKILLIPELNLGNYIFIYLLSFFVPIKVYSLSFFVKKLKHKWVPYLKTRKHMHWEDFPILRQKMTEIWEDIYKNFEPWGKNKIFKTEVETFKAAGEAFKLKLESLIIIEHMASNIKNSVFIDDFDTYYLKKLLTRKSDFGWISNLNILMSVLNYFIENLIYTAYTLYSFFDGLINNKKSKLKIKYLYDGVGRNELSISENEYSFSWLVDEKKIKKDEIFFLLPLPDYQVIKTAFRPEKDTTFLADYPMFINRYARKNELFLAIKEIMKQFVLSIINPSIRDIIKYKITIQILRWVPFIHSMKPKVYISNSCTIAQENPLVLYLNASGIHTITWSYSISFMSFLNEKKSNFKTPFYCHKFFSEYIFWNEHIKNYFKEHAQYNAKFKVFGPMMSSSEKIMQMDTASVVKELGLGIEQNQKYIALFDAPPPSNGIIPNPEYLDPINENKDFNELFIKHVFKLLEDFKEIHLIYKPKRSYKTGRFDCSEELKRIHKEMGTNPRVKILDYRTNPWLAIALADMCIAVPFGSPAFAAMHYGKPALFHDPKGIVRNHRYQDIAELVSHSYPELKDKVKQWLFDKRELVSLKEIQQFTGCFPRENSTEKFRDHLRTLAEVKNE